MFAWFFKGQRGNYVARYQSKIILPLNSEINSPGLFQIELIEESKTYYRARVLNPAAMLELPETSETSSIRLQLALDAFGPYTERKSVSSPGEDLVIRFYWSGIQQDQFEEEIDRRVSTRRRTFTTKYFSPTP
jgi:hypothetical protein